MQQQDLTHLETRIKDMCESLKSVADKQGFEEFFTIIHKPGFTSVAEIALLRGVVDSMHEQAKNLVALRQVLISGASKVELNPQPLPPKVGRAGGAAGD